MAAAERRQLALSALACALVSLGAYALWRRGQPFEHVQPTPAISEGALESMQAELEAVARDPLEVRALDSAASPEHGAPTTLASANATPVAASFVVTGRVRMTPAAIQLAQQRLLEAHVHAETEHGNVLRAARHALVEISGGFELDASDIAEQFFRPEEPIASVRVSVHAGEGPLAERLVERESVRCDEVPARACRLVLELELEERVGGCFVTGRAVDEQGRGVPGATVALLRPRAPPELEIETASSAVGDFVLRAEADGRERLLVVAAESYLPSTSEIGAIGASGVHLGERVLGRGHCLTGLVRMGALEQVDMPVSLSLWRQGLEANDATYVGGFARLRPFWTANGIALSGWHGSTQADRSFEFCGLPPGAYRLQLHGLERQATLRMETTLVDVAVPGGPVIVDFALPTLVVRVDCEEDEARAGVRVELRCGEQSTRAYTDRNGVAYLAGPAGAACTIAASRDGYATARASFAMPAAGAIAELGVALNKLPAGATLKLRVEDERGAPKDGWFGVSLFPDPGIEDARDLELDGRHVGDAHLVRDLRPGRWTVRARGRVPGRHELLRDRAGLGGARRRSNDRTRPAPPARRALAAARARRAGSVTRLQGGARAG